MEDRARSGRTVAARAASRRGGVIAALALTTCLIAPAGASAAHRHRVRALSFSQASTRALSILKPQRVAGRVVVFGLRGRLSARDQVIASQQGSGARVISDRRLRGGDLVTIRQAGRRLGRRAYLFWEDLAHDADFEHPSVLLLLDAANGHVLLKRALAFYPLIDGHLPVFLATAAGYDGPRYEIYSSERTARHASRVRASARARHVMALAAQALAVNPASFSHDCMIIMGDRNDPRTPSNFGADMDTMAALGREVGLHPIEAEPGNFGNDLSKLIAGPPACNDVVVFLAGHGYPATGANIPDGNGGTVPERALPTVDLGNHQTTHQDAAGHDVTETTDYEITSDWIKQLVSNFAPTHFKFIISSCFSGRFQAALQGVAGITLLATSSQANQFSYRGVTQVTIGGQTVQNPNPHPTNAGEFVNGLKLGFDLIIHNANLVAADGGENLAALLNAAVNTNGTNAVKTAGTAVPTSTYTPPPVPPVGPIGPEEFGSTLAHDPDKAAQATVDFVLWLINQVSGFAPRSGLAAHAAATGATAPADGQITQVAVRGYYVAGSCPVTATPDVCQSNLHFQDLRPQPDGSVKVISTTQAFTLPATLGTYTFQPTNFFVQRGDYVGLATVGGSWQVLVSAPGAVTDMFMGHNMDMNGAQFTSNNTQSGAQLDMKMTLQPSG